MHIIKQIHILMCVHDDLYAYIKCTCCFHSCWLCIDLIEVQVMSYTNCAGSEEGKHNVTLGGTAIAQQVQFQGIDVSMYEGSRELYECAFGASVYKEVCSIDTAGNPVYAEWARVTSVGEPATRRTSTGGVVVLFDLKVADTMASETDLRKKFPGLNTTTMISNLNEMLPANSLKPTSAMLLSEPLFTTYGEVTPFGPGGMSCDFDRVEYAVVCFDAVWG